MRKRLRWTLALGAIVAVAMAGMAIAKPVVIAAGNLVFTLNASVSPTVLPKNELVPIGFKISAALRTKDGKHPPAAQSFEGYLDKNGIINDKGLPVCRQGQLEARTTGDALAVCKSALIGRGFATAEVEFAESAPFDAKGPLLVFNGGTRGNSTLVLIHVYASVPAPTAFITRIQIEKINKGRFGYSIKSKIPVVAGGAGSLTKFSIANKKFFTYQGNKKSYFLGKCPTGRFLAEGSVSFSDSSRLKGIIVVPCTPKG